MEHIPDSAALAAAIPNVSDVAFVAAGGFKAVYSAQVGGERQALKVFYVPPDAEGQEGMRSQLLARLMREIRVLEECPNPGLVKLGALPPQQAIVAEHEYVAYSEELLNGRDLTHFVGAGTPPDLGELVSLALTLVSVVKDLWQAGYVHRDTKQGNIVRTGAAERPFIVLDLGSAFKMYGTQLTAEGKTLGTRLYMPPELFAPNYKQVIDFRSDLYSIGVTVYEYAAGLHPLVRQPEDDFTTVYRILKQKPEALELLRPDLPVAFCRLVDRCMRKIPALRFSDLGALMRELEAMQ